MALDYREPYTFFNLARQALEAILQDVYSAQGGSDGRPKLDELIRNHNKLLNLPRRVLESAKLVQGTGNVGSHASSDRPPAEVSDEDIATPRSALRDVIKWYFEIFRDEPIPEEIRRSLEGRSKTDSPVTSPKSLSDPAPGNGVERVLNRLSDTDFLWWPFLRLRPKKDERMSSLRMMKMTWSVFCWVAPGELFVLMVLDRALEPSSLREFVGACLMHPVYVVSLLLVTYLVLTVIGRLTYAVAWNRRAARLRSRGGQTLES
jgi:hypothetical protein